MIRINLLPVEKRRAERKPVTPAVILPALIAACLLGSLAGVGFLYFEIKGIEDETESYRRRRADLEPRLQEHTALSSKLAALQAKNNEIDSIITRQVEWWTALDAVWEVVQANDRVWIENVKSLDERGTSSELKRMIPEATVAPNYSLVVNCGVAGHNVEDMTRFRNMLKDHPVLRAKLPAVNYHVDWKVVAEPDYAERASIAFTVTLYGPTPRAPAAPAGVPGAPAPPPPPPPPPAGKGGAR
jgi:hypothetical protein